MKKSRILYFFHEVIFPAQLEFGTKILRFFGDQKKYDRLQIQISELPDGTIGKELHRMMEKNGINFVPWYEKHDLKHLVLGYLPTAPDEMRMQAFMFGNAGFSVFSIFTFSIFLIWTPDVWHDLPRHFRLGKKCKPIGGLKIEEVMYRNLEGFRREIGICMPELRSGQVSERSSEVH